MRKLLVLLLLVEMLISAGCGILQDVPHMGARWFWNQKKTYIEQHPNVSQEIKSAIWDGRILRSMTGTQVVASIGRPVDINSSVGSWGRHDQWVYSGYSGFNNPQGYHYLYFENGILTSWQY